MLNTPSTVAEGRACELRRITGKVGLPHVQPGALAAAALIKGSPLPIGLDLTESEARAVWKYRARLYPAARIFAAWTRLGTTAPLAFLSGGGHQGRPRPC